MTPAARSRAIALVLAETPNIWSDVSVIETVHRLGFTITQIGSTELIAALDEARAQMTEDA